jgi:CHAT domain-containing protein
MAGRNRGTRPKLRTGLTIAIALVLAGAATQIADKLDAPIWLFGGVVVLAAAIAVAQIWRTQSQAAEAAWKDWTHRLASLLAIGPPVPRVKEATPYGAIGVSPSKYSKASGLDEYVARDVDKTLRKELLAKPFVLVIGEAKAGKSRTAYEAAVSVMGDSRLIVPRDDPGLLHDLALLEAPADVPLPDGFEVPLDSRDQALVWLDDLERFLGSRGLSPELLERWDKANIRVLATMRSENLERKSTGQEELGRNARLVLMRAHEVFLQTYLSEDEAQAAAHLYPEETFEGVSIGATLVSAKDLIRKFELGHSTNPIGVALVRAAVDWRRGGGGRTIAESDLKEIYLGYVDPRVPEGEDYEKGVQWACEHVPSNVSLLSVMTGSARAFAVFDYLVTYVERRDAGVADSIPELTWRTLVRRAEASGDVNLRFARYGQHSDTVKQFLGRSVRALEESVPERDAQPAALDAVLTLADALIERYFVTGSSGDLDRSIELLRQAVVRLSADDAELPLALNRLGTALGQRYATTRDIAQLEEARQVLERVASSLPPTAPQQPAVLAQLSRLLDARFVRFGDESDLEQSIDLKQRALEKSPSGSPERPPLLRELARALKSRVPLNEADTARAAAAYRQAVATGFEVSPPDAVQSAREWGDWMMERGDWTEAAEAYEAGLEAMLRAIAQQGLIPEERAWIRAAEGLPARASYALVQTDQVERAAVALELGRTLILVEALEEHPAALEELGTVDEELRAEYRRLRVRWNELVIQLTHNNGSDETSTDESLASVDTELACARVELDAVILAIRRSAGSIDGVARPPFAELRAAAEVPVVFLAAAQVGGVAVIVEPERRASPPRAVLLPEMTEQNVTRAIRLAKRIEQDLPWSIPERGAELSQWLWDAVMGPVLETVAPAPRIVVIPTGRLASLPLHAAGTEDLTTPTGRRFVLDDIAITYAWSARALARRRESRGETSTDSFLAVAPGPSVRAAEREVLAAAELSASSQVLIQEAATRAAVLDGLRRCTAFHFAGHGFVSSDAPLSGGLLLAGDDIFTVRDALELAIDNVRLAVLSTSDVARSASERFDETMTMPVALMEAGVATVIAPQGTLTDHDAAWIMSRFFYELRAHGREPWEALRRAQLAFRDEHRAEQEGGNWSWTALICLGG